MRVYCIMYSVCVYIYTDVVCCCLFNSLKKKKNVFLFYSATNHFVPKCGRDYV